MEVSEQIQILKWDTKMLRELEPLCYDETLRELGLFILNKGRLWGNFIPDIQ